MTWHTDGPAPAARHARLRKYMRSDDPPVRAVPVRVELYRTTAQPLTLGELRVVLADPDVVAMPDGAEVECHIDPRSLLRLTIRWDDDRG